MLRATDRPLTELHDLVMLDLDGVVYIGGRAVAGAPEALDAARAAGAHLAFVTNNAARPPEVVAEHLRSLGVTATADDVVTSAQAAAGLLADRLPAGATVFLVGAEGLSEALTDRGLVPVTDPDGDPAAVVTGYGPDVPWRRILQGAILIQRGLPWVASNTDGTIPTDLGVGPGHGVLVRMLADYAGVEPEVAGKPAPPLLRETIARVGGRRPLMVGDRLDTDIRGGRAVDVETLLVLTGVTGLPELAAAGPDERPSYLAPDLAGLLETQPEVTSDGAQGDGTWRCGGWRASTGSGLRVDGDGSPADWWRAVAAACWAHLDAHGRPVDVGDTRPPPG